MQPSRFALLERVNQPEDLRRLAEDQLPALAQELRAFILDSVSKTGGHLSSNLGSVELSVALHYCYNTPYDRLIWDVGHQSYPHKILTGRREATLSELAQRLDEHGQIMSVNRADVVKAKLFKERAGREHALDMLFKPARKRKKTWQMLEEPLAQRLGGTVKAPEQKPCEIVTQGAHRRGNRHLVVVQDHQNIKLAGGSAVIHRFKSHTAA
ncbi:MAG: hypothetical protein EBX72_08105 [Betaproteobacteria bacterium]|nr:hypothetical protein [Betaproteobacteria bacterium]